MREPEAVIILILIAHFSLQANGAVVEGKVRSSQTGTSVEFGNVRLVGSKLGSPLEPNGSYSIKDVPIGNTF